MLQEFALELGKVLLKVQLSKGQSADFLRQVGGRETEKVLLQKIGKFWNQQNWLDRPDGLVVVTNHRLVFLSKVTTFTTQTDFLSFPYEHIEDLKKTRVWFFVPAIEFNIAATRYVFTFFSNADEVIQAVEQAKKPPLPKIILGRA
jgi:hypothetical protein